MSATATCSSASLLRNPMRKPAPLAPVPFLDLGDVAQVAPVMLSPDHQKFCAVLERFGIYIEGDANDRKPTCSPRRGAVVGGYPSQSPATDSLGFESTPSLSASSLSFASREPSRISFEDGDVALMSPRSTPKSARRVHFMLPEDAVQTPKSTPARPSTRVTRLLPPPQFKFRVCGPAVNMRRHRTSATPTSA